MRKRILISLGVVACIAVLIEVVINVFPDQAYESLALDRDIAQAVFHPAQFPIPRTTPKVVVPYWDQDGYDVMSAWLEHSGQRLAVIRQETVTSIRKPDETMVKLAELLSECLSKDGSEGFSQAVADLGSKNVNAQILEARLKPFEAYQVALDSRLAIAVKEQDTKGTHARTGGYGYFAFSAVGFNSERSIAVGYAEDISYSDDMQHTCVGGSYFAFRRENHESRWVPLPVKACAWIQRPSPPWFHCISCEKL